LDQKIFKGFPMIKPHRSVGRYCSRSFVFSLLLVALGALLLTQASPALDDTPYTLAGYITASRSPGTFEINMQRVAITRGTVFKLIGDGQTVNRGMPLRDEMRVGTYVEVMGRLSYLTMTLTADSVSIWDDWNKKLSAMGVIVRVVSTGAEPVFQVDGYRVRIAHNTKTIFGEGLGTLDDVGTNTWLRFQGRRGKDGVVEATKAIFLPARLDKTKTAGEQKTEIQNGKVKLGKSGGWHAIVTDTAMQERIVRVGMRVLPQYQQKLADDDPSKIHIQFYAVDAAKVHSEMSSADGTILVPKQVLERLKSDDQLAAVMADGVAFQLQQQAVRMQGRNWTQLGVEVAAEAAWASVLPFSGVIAVLGPVLGESSPEQQLLEEQRGRIALSLMADAGYDPWQAPEAWRLLEPNRLPRDVSSLPYPDRTGYQMNILSLQYVRANGASAN
jgi:hypothetical protein